MKTTTAPFIAQGQRWLCRFCLQRLPIAVFSVILGAMCSSELSFAQSGGGQGIVQGRVYNVETDNYVEGAEVYIEGSNRRATTNRLGRYEIRGVESGEVTIKAVVRGIAEGRASVSVSVGETVSVPDIGIGGQEDVFELEAFVVSLNEEVHALEIAMQRDAPNVITAIGTEAYGNVGSNSVGNLLQHVAGLTIEGFDGEAHTVSVRGMDPSFGSITSDGAKLADQAEGGGGLNRAPSVLEIGLVNFSEIEVIKAPTPDRAADSTGGVINLKTRSVFASRKPSSGRISVGLSAPLRNGAEFESIDPNITFNYRRLLGENADDAKWGFTLNGSYSTRYLLRDQTTINYEGSFETENPNYPYITTLGKQIGHQELNRRAFGGNLEFRPSDTSRFLFGYRYNGSDRFSDNNTRDWNSRGTAIGDPVLPAGYEDGTRYTGSVRIGDDYTADEIFWPRGEFYARSLRNKQETEQHVLRFAGDHDFGPWKIEYSVNHSTYERRSRESRDWGGQSHYRIRDVGIRATGFEDSPDWDVEYVGGYAPDDFANMFDLRFDDWNANFSDNEVLSTKLDVSRFLDIENAPTYLKAGLSFDSSTQEQLPTVWDRYTYTGTKADYSYERFGRSSSNANPDINYNPVDSDWEEFMTDILDSQAVRADVFGSNSSDWNGPDPRPGGNVDRGWGEDILAGYFMATTKLFDERLTLLGGLRFEKTKVSAYDNVNPDPVSGTPNTIGNDSYTDLYPSLHGTWRFLSGWQARASYSTSIGRVSPGNIIPSVTVRADNEGTLGDIDVVNVGLEPRYVDNFEGSIEYYPEVGGSFSFGIFRKEMSNFIYDDTQVIGSGTDNGFDGDFAGWQLNTKTNGGEGVVEGWELDYRSPSLGTYVSWLEGFSLFGNYTKLKASGDYGDGGDATLAGFKPETGNLGIAYRKGGTSVQVRGNFRGEYLRFFNSDPVLTRWEYDQTKYDINFEQKITDSVSFYLDIINVTNTNGRRFWGPPEQGRRLAWVDDNGSELYSGINYVF